MTETILVTGASGYIGRHVVKALCDSGKYDVVCSTRKSNSPDPRAIRTDQPIFDFDAPDFFSRLGSPNRCIHLAWRDGFNHKSNAHLDDLPKHVRFIEKLAENGITSISIMGSMHEIGYWEGPVDENTPTNPLSLYGIAKNALREAASVVLKDTATQLKWLRAFYLTGDDTSNHSIFSKILECANAGKKRFPFNSGANKYDFINIDEAAEQIVLASVQDETNGIINCCSGTPISLAEKVEQFINENNLDIQLEYGAFPDRPYDSPAIWGDSTKIQSILARSSVSQEGR